LGYAERAALFVARRKKGATLPYRLVVCFWNELLRVPLLTVFSNILFGWLLSAALFVAVAWRVMVHSFVYLHLLVPLTLPLGVPPLGRVAETSACTCLLRCRLARLRGGTGMGPAR